MKHLRKQTTDSELPKSKYNATKALLSLDDEKITKLTREQHTRLKEGDGKGQYLLFDSEMEARYYRDILLPMVKERSIIVELQPKFTLLPKFEKEGTKHQAITYTPDFKVTYFSGKTILIDVKGMEDQKFPIKRKLFDYMFPDLPPLVVMKYVKKFGGWITIEEYAVKKREEQKLLKAK